MRAIRFEGLGDTGVIQFVEASQPRLRPCDLLVRVHAVGATGPTSSNGRAITARTPTMEICRFRAWRSPEKYSSFATGQLVPIVAHEFPLAKAAEAHRLMEAAGYIGKIVLTVD